MLKPPEAKAGVTVLLSLVLLTTMVILWVGLFWSGHFRNQSSL